MKFTVLRFERQKLGIGAAAVARTLGIDIDRYRHFERGDSYRRLSPTELAAVTDFLKVPADRLVESNGLPKLVE